MVIKKDGIWYIQHSYLPMEMSNDPLEGMHYAQFKVDTYKGLVHVHIYDHRFFTRCEPDFRVYLPDLKLLDGIVDVLVCLYPVPGTLPHARVQRVVFDPTKIDLETVEKWIRDNKLHTWVSKQIKKSRR